MLRLQLGGYLENNHCSKPVKNLFLTKEERWQVAWIVIINYEFSAWIYHCHFISLCLNSMTVPQCQFGNVMLHDVHHCHNQGDLNWHLIEIWLKIVSMYCMESPEHKWGVIYYDHLHLGTMVHVTLRDLGWYHFHGREGRWDSQMLCVLWTLVIGHVHIS